MADEAIWTYASQVTLEASGASCAATSYSSAGDADLASANHLNFPYADFILKCDFGAAVAAGTTVGLYRREMNIDSGSDAPSPSASYPHQLVGLFHITSGQSASADYPCVGVAITKDCQFFIKNNTAQSITAGWVLKATPKTLEPSA
jgi:hypothetical protein